MTLGTETAPAAANANEAAALRLAQEIRHRIQEGRYAHNARLPSERTLCGEYGVSRRAARQCVELLEREGLIYRLQRTGAFVRATVFACASSAAPCPVRAITFVEDVWPVPPDRQSFLADYLAAYTEVLDHTDTRMRFVPHGQREARFDRLFSEAFPLQEQACILANVAPPDLMNWLHAHRIPFVVQFYRDYDMDGLPPHHGVCVNKFRGAYDAVKHLLELGHRRIAFMGLPDAAITPLYGGFMAAMQWAACPAYRRDVLCLSTDDANAAYEPAVRFLKTNREITALYAQTDAGAIGALRAARALGIRVPEDLSVVGSNDIIEAAETDPPLTTVALPRRLLARTAVEMLLKVIAGACDSWQRQVLDCRLIVRKSAGPPRTKAEAAARSAFDAAGGVDVNAR